MAHTPGPWERETELGSRLVRGAKGEWVADVKTVSDAHLIAAAPELLQALKAEIKQLEDKGGTPYVGSIAAILKAEGRQ